MERKCSENLYFRGENDIFPQRVPSMYREDKGKAIYPRLVNKGPRDYYYELFEELGWTSNTFSHKTFEQILEIQHYGAVTNILDITTNPLVALFLHVTLVMEKMVGFTPIRTTLKRKNIILSVK